MTIAKRQEIERIEDRDQRNLVDHIFQEAFGNPISFDSAPSASDLEPNTWGYNGTDLYIKYNDGTAVKFSGTTVS